MVFLSQLESKTRNFKAVIRRAVSRHPQQQHAPASEGHCPLISLHPWRFL